MAKLVCNFYSYVLNRAVDITVILPSVTCPESLGMADYPPSHVLPGRFPEERRIAVVNLSTENKSYAKVGGDDFMKFVSEELPEFILNYFPVSPLPEDTYIAGLSMGGYGSYLHAFTHPEKYCAVGAFSAGIDINPQTLVYGLMTNEQKIDPAYDIHALAKKLKEDGKTFPKVYASCGDQDFLYAADKAYAEELKELGADVTWTETAGYGHEWRFWDEQVEKFLDWIPRTDDYAKMGKRSV